MIFGYLRVSTTDKQDFDRQLYLLSNSQYEIPERNLYFDKVSGKSIDNREQYLILKKIVRSGDVVIFTELSRLSRNYNQVSEEMAYFKNIGVGLIFLDMPFLNSNGDNLTQQLINDICINLFSYVAQVERENTSKRIKQKLDSLKKSGVKLGRPTITLNVEQQEIFEQYVTQFPNRITGKEASQLAGLNINTFYKQLRIYKEQKVE